MKYRIEIQKGIFQEKGQILKEDGTVAFELSGKKYAMSRQITLKDRQSKEEIVIQENSMAISNNYKLMQGEKEIIRIKGTPKNKNVRYPLDAVGLIIKGNMKAMDFSIFDSTNTVISTVAKENKKEYVIDITEEKEALLLLAINLAVYCLNTADEVAYGGAVF